MLAGVLKPITEFLKRFEGFQKEVVEQTYYFLLGIALDAGKGMGWKGNLYVWPFAAAFAVVAFLIIRAAVLFVWNFIF